jgi:hypothetical protein
MHRIRTRIIWEERRERTAAAWWWLFVGQSVFKGVVQGTGREMKKKKR